MLFRILVGLIGTIILLGIIASDEGFSLTGVGAVILFLGYAFFGIGTKKEKKAEDETTKEP